VNFDSERKTGTGRNKIILVIGMKLEKNKIKKIK